MNNEPINVKEAFHGLKAAEQLLLLIADQVKTGRLRLSGIAIDYEDGTTRNFKPQEYCAFAMQAVVKTREFIRAVAEAQEDRE